MKKMRGLKSFTFRVDVDDRISQLYNRLDALPLVIRNFMSFSRNVDRVDLHTNCTAIFCSKSYGIFRRTYATAMYERGSRQGNDQMLFFFFNFTSFFISFSMYGRKKKTFLAEQFSRKFNANWEIQHGQRNGDTTTATNKIRDGNDASHLMMLLYLYKQNKKFYASSNELQHQLCCTKQ